MLVPVLVDFERLNRGCVDVIRRDDRSIRQNFRDKRKFYSGPFAIKLNNLRPNKIELYHPD